jgi:protoporphyrinogen oxidase
MYMDPRQILSGRQNGSSNEPVFPVAIIGAGPAGLTAGYLLSRQGRKVAIFESDPEYVGGISRTVEYKGCHIDIGGHRFFSKSSEVTALWKEILPKDLIVRRRSSRIYYKGKLYSYPLNPVEALMNLGLIEAGLCVMSFAWAKLFPTKNPRNFEEWVVNQFGRRLFSIFFKTYTEKVWGMSCTEISADWAAQRIGKLSLGKAIFRSLPIFKQISSRTNDVKTLIEDFLYPRKGPGMLWAECADKIRKMDSLIFLGHRVTSCLFNKEQNLWEIHATNREGHTKIVKAHEVISSAPIREVMNNLSPQVPVDIRDAANGLRYRDFMCIAIVVRKAQETSDQWIYVHDPSVNVGRIQNFAAWSPEMVPDKNTACYGMEYFCTSGDRLWETSDENLLAMAREELVKLGIADQSDIVDGKVIRQLKAYPIYDDVYQEHVLAVRTYLEENYPSLHLVGRNGMHKYNNQDHAMMTAMLVVKNILAGRKIYDPWKVNQDAEYIEDSSSETQLDRSGATGLRAVPTRASSVG